MSRGARQKEKQGSDGEFDQRDPVRCSGRRRSESGMEGWDEGEGVQLDSLALMPRG